MGSNCGPRGNISRKRALHTRLRKLCLTSGSWHTAPLIRGRQYGRATELRDAGLCGQEEAHEARRISSRDGGGGAVVSAGSSDRAALSEGGSSRRPSSAFPIAVMLR